MTEWFDYKSKTIQKRDIASDKGGTMRLGAYPCILEEGSLAYRAYGQKEISERHRHRYEFNNDFRERLKQAGLVMSGISPDGQLVEIVEVRDHPWFLGCQFHPEFKSRPMNPHPLFVSFIRSALDHKNRRTEQGSSNEPLTAGGESPSD
jgi:CTP synthase